MKQIILLSILIITVISCNKKDTTPSEEKIWNDESVKIHITQDLGNVPSGPRYNETEFTKQQLDPNQLNILKSLKLSEKNELNCVVDGTTYSVKVYQINNQFKEYYSNNTACNDYSSKRFISTEQIEKIISPLCTINKK